MPQIILYRVAKCLKTIITNGMKYHIKDIISTYLHRKMFQNMELIYSRSKMFRTASLKLRVWTKWFFFSRLVQTTQYDVWSVLFSMELRLLNPWFECLKIFSESSGVIENLVHANRPSASVNIDNIKKVKKKVLENCYDGVRDIAENLNIS